MMLPVHCLDREVDAALEVHSAYSGGDSLGSLPDDRVSEHGRRGRAVTVEDFDVTVATYRAACLRWPGAKITLRQGARVVDKNW